jgi:fused-like protein
VNKVFSSDFVTLSLSFGLLCECINISQTFFVFNPKFIKLIKEIVKGIQGRGKEENKKIEGTSFGFPRNAILDYPFMYLEKIFKISQSKDKTRNDFITAFLENQFDDIVIDIICNFSYKNDISPRGILAGLNLLSELVDKKYNYQSINKKICRDHFIKQIIVYLKVKQYSAIQDWPGYKKEEGASIAQGLLCAALKLLRVASEFCCFTEEIIKSDFLLNLRNSFEFLTKENYVYPVNVIHNLLNARNSNDDIVAGIVNDYFIQYVNLKFIEKYALLKDYHNKDMIIDVLLILSSLCRPSQNVYKVIHDLNIYNDIKTLIEGSDSNIKARVCNLIGNMCRHTDFFYEEIKNQGLITPLLKCCYDIDKMTRKFACFAIGNAAFLNNKLYDHFRPIIPKMVELLVDPEPNTRANSAGALGNFVRCGDNLVNDIIIAKAPEGLLKLAENEEIPEQIQIIKVALFALGNFCNHKKEIKNELEKFNFKQRIEQLQYKFRNEPQLIEHLDRIKKKLKE